MLQLLLVAALSLTGSTDIRNINPSVIDTGAVIQHIRLQFQEINSNVSSFRKEERDLTDFSTEGGHMQKFYDKANKLKKITCEFYGEIGKAHEEYYISNDSLFFVYRKEYRYKKPMDPVGSKITEERYYLYNNKIILWLKDKQKIKEHEFPDKARDILEGYKKFLKLT